MTTKRFIAGAVCPSCGVQDSIQMFEQNGVNVRECVDCGFSDALPDQPALVGSVPETRISHEKGKHEEIKTDDEIQVVHILGNVSSP